MSDSLLKSLICNLNARGWFVTSLYQAGDDKEAWRLHLTRHDEKRRCTIGEGAHDDDLTETVMLALANAVTRDLDIREPVFATTDTYRTVHGLSFAMLARLGQAIELNGKARAVYAGARSDH